MKKLTKIIIIGILTIIAVGLIIALFVSSNDTFQISKETNQENQAIYEKNIIDPDRIVYRNQNGQYYQFAKDTDGYNQIRDSIKNSLVIYSESGNTLTQEEIDNIHEKSFIEFDYETASKNYIIPLEEIEEPKMIKLGTTGGIVVSTNVEHLEEMIKIAEEQSENEMPYTLEYKEMISRNQIQTMEYKYLQQFKEINYKIHQVKIQDMETYELYKAMCNLAFDEEINEEIFKNNDLILTVSLVPKIDVKVNIGNIQYTYDRLDNAVMQYTAHLLVVSKIVNTDCIYNTDLTEIDAKVDREEFELEYDEAVENLDTETFVTDFDSFYQEYQNATGEITQEQAEEVAEKAFKEAERVVGSYDKQTQECTETQIKPNGFFTRKYNEGEQMAQYTVEVYAFTRKDEMMCGVTVYIDKKLGKVVGAESFGD